MAFITLLLLQGFASYGQSSRQTIQKKMDSLVEAKAIPGIIVALYEPGRRQYLSAGFANTELKQVFDSTTQLEIGSITKTFTSYILSAILFEKKISETETIGKYLPDSISGNKAVTAIQFIQLMNHTSGLPRLATNMSEPKNPLQPYGDYDLNKLFSYLLNAVPDTNRKVNYSNLGFTLAGVLAERISGKPYDLLLRTYMTIPWGLQHTGLTVNKSLPVSVGFFNDSIAPYWTMNGLGGAGEIKSTPGDQLTYLQQMLNHSDETLIQTLITPTSTINDRLKVARGWHVLTLKDQPPIYWHNGGTYGFSTFCGFNKSSNTGVFVAINAFAKNSIADQIGVSVLRTLQQQ